MWLCVFVCVWVWLCEFVCVHLRLVACHVRLCGRGGLFVVVLCGCVWLWLFVVGCVMCVCVVCVMVVLALRPVCVWLWLVVFGGVCGMIGAVWLC